MIANSEGRSGLSGPCALLHLFEYYCMICTINAGKMPQTALRTKGHLCTGFNGPIGVALLLFHLLDIGGLGMDISS
jgi:hypothetical protein